jgi:hypothetical protein
VHFRVLPCGIVLVLDGLEVMTECNPSVMRGLLVIARLVMLGGLTMVFGGVFVMLRRLFVMLVNLVLCHSVLPNVSWLEKGQLRPKSNLTPQFVYELIARPAV